MTCRGKARDLLESPKHLGCAVGILRHDSRRGRPCGEVDSSRGSRSGYARDGFVVAHARDRHTNERQESRSRPAGSSLRATSLVAGRACPDDRGTLSGRRAQAAQGRVARNRAVRRRSAARAGNDSAGLAEPAADCALGARAGGMRRGIVRGARRRATASLRDPRGAV